MTVPNNNYGRHGGEHDNHDTPLVGQALLVLKDSGATGSDCEIEMSKTREHEISLHNAIGKRISQFDHANSLLTCGLAESSCRPTLLSYTWEATRQPDK